MSKYKHLFFDLDHTLYDFELSSELTLLLIYEQYDLYKDWSFVDFHDSYKKINKTLWDQLRDGETTKEALKTNRFLLTLRERQECSVTQAKAMSELYMEYAPLQPTLIEGARTVVEALSKKYQLHIITNGFVEAQYRKLEATKLSPFFKHIFISEKIGASKPAVKFFQHAIRSCNALKSESLVIGDNLETDIQGAINFKLDSVWFRPDNLEGQKQESPATYEIARLSELLLIL